LPGFVPGFFVVVMTHCSCFGGASDRLRFIRDIKAAVQYGIMAISWVAMVSYGASRCRGCIDTAR